MTSPDATTFSDVYPLVHSAAQLSDAKLLALWNAATRLGSVPGDLAELGVFRGGVSRLLARACPTRTVHLFDTFTGIPWDGFDVAIDFHRPGEFAGSFEDVSQYLSDCPNVRLHPGLFPHTAVDGVFALVHLDADLYESTLAGLKWFWTRVSVGGCIVLDDWHWPYCRGVELAVNQFFADHADYQFIESAPHQLTVLKT